MASGTRLEVGSDQAIPVRIRKMIQSIREIVGDHSETDIYAILKETSMDPNETTQKLLNQDSFHEVKRKRDMRKQFTGRKLVVDPRKHPQSIRWEKSNRSMSLNAHRGSFMRGYAPAMQQNMEWKPKSQKINTDNSSTVETSFILSSNDNAFGSNPGNAIDLPELLSHVNIHAEQQVIIPQHLRVSKAECRKLKFGSFGDEFVFSEGSLSTQQALGEHNENLVEVQPETSKPVSPATPEKSGVPSSEYNHSLSPHSFENFTDIGLVHNHSPSFSSQQPQGELETQSMPGFLQSYEPETSYVDQFFHVTLDGNSDGHSIASQSEPQAPIIHTSASIPLIPTAVSLQQQQQAMYPQIHIPTQYQNFVPYHHIIPPLYAPPMTVPSYSSNRSSYVLMHGGSSHLPAGGMKFGPSHFKPLSVGNPAAYGNYSSSTAFAIGSPNPIGGAAGLNNIPGIKYKDNNLYVPNQQVQTSDMWMQTPRELSSLPPTPYYNLSGHSAHPSAFVSATMQPSAMLYPPGMYHPQQPASMAAPHHHLLHHQQVPPQDWGISVVPSRPPKLSANF